MEKGQFGNILKVTFIITVLATFVLADQKDTTMTWVVPASIAHSLAYGGGCDASNFFFVVNTTTGNGHLWGSGCTGGAGIYACENATIPRDDNLGTNPCQNVSAGAITVTNDGNAVINISVQMYLAQTNITLKAQHAISGTGCGTNGNQSYDSGACGNDPAGPPNEASCITVTSTEKILIKHLNVSQSQETCWFSDFEGTITASNSTNVSTYGEIT